MSLNPFFQRFPGAVTDPSLRGVQCYCVQCRRNADCSQLRQESCIGGKCSGPQNRLGRGGFSPFPIPLRTVAGAQGQQQVSQLQPQLTALPAVPGLAQPQPQLVAGR